MISDLNQEELSQSMFPKYNKGDTWWETKFEDGIGQAIGAAENMGCPLHRRMFIQGAIQRLEEIIADDENRRS